METQSRLKQDGMGRNDAGLIVSNYRGDKFNY